MPHVAHHTDDVQRNPLEVVGQNDPSPEGIVGGEVLPLKRLVDDDDPGRVGGVARVERAAGDEARLEHSKVVRRDRAVADHDVA